MTSAAPPPERARLYRMAFGAAAVYNLVFGAWAVFRPLDFFTWFDLAPPRYPAIWSCLGMVIGLYGVGYAYAARRLDRAAPFIAIGLLGKILGPLGWISTVAAGEWPFRTLPMIVFNDLIWWMPFGLFLLEGTRVGERFRGSAPYVCGGANLLASIAMVTALRPGTPLTPDAAARLTFIREHATLWISGWCCWMAAALSLLAFYAWWAAGLRRPVVSSSAVAIAAAGVSCDLFAESLLASWLPDAYGTIMNLATFLTAAVANGLYTVAGVILTMSTPSIPGPLRVWSWIVWMSGAALTAAALTGDAGAISVTTGVLFALFCPWVIVMGRHLRTCA